MPTISRPIRHVLTLVGMGLMLVVLFGGPASAADVEPFDSQHDWVAQNSWGQQEYRGPRDPWGLQDP